MRGLQVGHEHQREQTSLFSPRLADDPLGGAVATRADALLDPSQGEGVVVGDRRSGRQHLAGEPSSSQRSTHSGTKSGPSLAWLQNTVSRSVSSSRVTPPRSSRQRTRRSKLTSRVQLEAIRIAGMRLWPRIATMAGSSTSSSPSGQLPMCFQSAWVCTPGKVSRRGFERVFLEVLVLVHPALGPYHFERIGRCHQNICEQAIRIQRYRRHERIELGRLQRRLIRNRRGRAGWRLSRHAAWRLGARIATHYVREY